MQKKQVVVAFDFSETADVALRRAVEIGWRSADHVLHVVTVSNEHDYHRAEELEQRIHDRVREMVDERPLATVEFYVHALIGDPSAEILRVAEDVGADLVVIGSHGRTGIRRLLLGSTSEAVVRGAGCAVIVARPKEYADVQLEKVFDAEPSRTGRQVPHRYFYTSGISQTRPDAWPIS
jgi:nucleotide-binding universal stress UspA family protein